MNGTWEEKRGGVDPRAAISRAFPHQTAVRCTRGLVLPALRYGSSNHYLPTRHKKNSAQFRPFSMKPVQSCSKFRDAAREDDPVVITRQISTVFEEMLEFQEKSDENRQTSAKLIFPTLVQDHSRSVPELEKH